MINEFDSAEELKLDAKLLHEKLRLVRNYVDPYAEWSDNPAKHTDHMERWPELQLHYQLP